MSFPAGCPYCGEPVKIVDSIVIYKKRSYGLAYVCSAYPKCDAYVGCHPNTDRPLGRLADKKLRTAKSAAHRAFDALWRRKANQPGQNEKAARIAGYRWLAKQLGIRRQNCHVGMFDVEQCLRVVEICKPYIGAKA